MAEPHPDLQLDTEDPNFDPGTCHSLQGTTQPAAQLGNHLCTLTVTAPPSVS
ncbi:hypothetical protein CGRA01v4_05416 [Colletotrichum graminicola]|nr:hypothetical protein CGRA01v4_05416 [Colletotrichum graminicola]